MHDCMTAFMVLIDHNSVLLAGTTQLNIVRMVALCYFSGLLFSLQLVLIHSQIEKYSQESCLDNNCRSCNDCESYPNYCYCDSACLSLNDCCSDIYQLDYCETIRGSECDSGSVRLVGGTNDAEGLVEICIFQSWYPMCVQQFSENEAGVVCNWLGYSLGEVTYANGSSFGKYGAICSGSETRLTECLIDINFCTYNTTLQPFVTCNTSDQLPSCTADCNPQLDGVQYEKCCDPDNYGKIIAIKSSGSQRYIICPDVIPDWCK